MSAEESKLDALRRATESLNPELRSFILDLAQQAPPASSEPAASADDTTWSPSRPLMAAAICDTFTVRELEGSGEELRDVLQRSVGVMSGGERRLMLQPEVRAEVLGRAQDMPEFEQMLAAATLRDTGVASNAASDVTRRRSGWIRSFVAPATTVAEPQGIDDLRDAVAAREAVQLVKLGPFVPELAELRRRLELAELLEPLRILIGSQVGSGGQPATDRFVGRAAELRDLRSYVDELKAESSLEAIGRFTQRAAESIVRNVYGRGPGALMLEGRGGMGKSSLVAKFVLDHVDRAERRFPFAYFDFDRAALQPREPLMLLRETVRQVALQFPDIVAECEILLGELTAADDQQKSDPFAAFRSILDVVFVSTPGTFLLILDTMEVVQSDRRAVDGLLMFLARLEGDAFPELRIVASGRAEVPELIAEVRSRSKGRHQILDPLSAEDGRRMADQLGLRLLGSKDWKDSWAARIVGGRDALPARREPLVIRVAVEFLRDTDAADRDEASLRIERDGELADASFVGKLYQRRILEHVQDRNARRLAWPGLILRSLTVEIARELLAEICDIPADEIERAFDLLGQEVWMVDRVGGSLRHRPDLRARTLPLMKLHDPERFTRVNTAAVEYFGALRTTSVANRAEWLYHRLLGGEDPAEVDRDWDDDVAPHLAQALEDFETLFPATALYLRARTSSRLLDSKALTALDSALAFEHVARVAPHLGEFDDTTIDPSLLALWGRDAKGRPLSVNGQAAVLVFGVKTGCWEREDEVADTATGRWAQMCAFAMRYKRARTLSRESAREVAQALEQESANAPAWSTRDSRTLLAQDLAAARILKHPLADDLERRWLLESPPTSRVTATDLAAMRTAASFATSNVGAIANEWLIARSRTSSHRSSASVSGAELLALCGDDKVSRGQLLSALAPACGQAGIRVESIEKRIVERVPLRITDPGVVAQVDLYVGRLHESGGPKGIAAVRRFMSARNEDWLAPLGYCAARLIGSPGLVGPLLRRLNAYAPETSQSSMPLPTDPLKALQWADEAGDLLGVADAILNARPADAPGRAQFRALLGHLQNWNMAILAIDDPELDVTHPLLDSGPAGDRPPEPGPIRNSDDLQKDRWGGLAERNGRRLDAALIDVKRGYFTVDLIVSSTDGTELEGPVVFHLHDTYPRSVIHIRKMRGSSARLEQVTATGVYAVGAQVRDGEGRWIGLEYDLATLPGVPGPFLER